MDGKTDADNDRLQNDAVHLAGPHVCAGATRRQRRKMVHDADAVAQGNIHDGEVVTQKAPHKDDHPTLSVKSCSQELFSVTVYY